MLVSKERHVFSEVYIKSRPKIDFLLSSIVAVNKVIIILMRHAVNDFLFLSPGLHLKKLLASTFYGYDGTLHPDYIP